MEKPASSGGGEEADEAPEAEKSPVKRGGPFSGWFGRKAKAPDGDSEKADDAEEKSSKPEAVKAAPEKEEKPSGEEGGSEVKPAKRPGLFSRLFKKKKPGPEAKAQDDAEVLDNNTEEAAPSGEGVAGEPDKPKKRRGFLFFGQKKDQPEEEPVEEEVVEFEESDPAKRGFWQKLTSKTPEPGTRKKKKKKFRWPWSQEKEVPEEEPELPPAETPTRARPVTSFDPLPLPETKPREPETGLAPVNPNPPPPGKRPDPIDEIDLYPGRN